MRKDNIFLEDVEVPKIVQKKADLAFLAIQAERNETMRNIADRKRKTAAGRFVAAAACAAVVIASGTLAGPFRGVLGHFGKEQSGFPQKGAEDAVLTAVDKLDRIFTLQVKAAESENAQFVPLAEGKPVPVVIGDEIGGSWVIGSNETRSKVNYCIAIPQMICEGEQIESITYSINHGAFQIVQPENEKSLIVDGEFYEGELNTGSIGGDYSEERDGKPSKPFEILLYKSFTLDYDRQSDEYTWMNICNEREDSEEMIQLIWEGNGSEEEQCNGIHKMLDDTVITCTVHYSDNSFQSADIKVDSCVMTRRELGEPLNEGLDPEEKMTVVTFELQQ